jgi:hypothetical protein
MAARSGASRAEELLVAAEALAEEFGETVVLGALIAALKRRLANRGFTGAESRAAGRHHEAHPVYAQLDEIGPPAEEGEHARRAADVGVHDQAAPGRASFRSLLGGRRSSEGLVDEDQALANCKPLSTAVLSVSRERPRTPGFEPRFMPMSSRSRGQRDDRRSPSQDARTAPRPGPTASSLAGSPTASSRRSGGEDAA